MDRSRWLLFGALLVVVFVASAAIGAFIGRQQGDQSVSAVTTPTPGASATVNVTPAPPSASPSPSPGPSPRPTVPPTPSVAPTEALDPPTAEEFAADLLAAIQTGDTQYLADRLHPIVFERYGEQQCRAHVAGFTADPTVAWTVVSSRGPASWTWATDALSTVIADTWSVTVNEPGTGNRDLHFAPSAGQWRWFLDCGDPI